MFNLGSVGYSGKLQMRENIVRVSIYEQALVVVDFGNSIHHLKSIMNVAAFGINSFF